MNYLSGEERSYDLKLVMQGLEFMYADAIGIPFILYHFLLWNDNLNEYKTKAKDHLFESASQQVFINDENRKQYESKDEQLFVKYTVCIIMDTSEMFKDGFWFTVMWKRTKTRMQCWLVHGLLYSAFK